MEEKMKRMTSRFFVAVVVLVLLGCTPPVNTTAVSFSSLTANGTSNLVDTTELTLNFDANPSTLTVDDITITGASKGTLNGTGLTRTLSISAITVANGANVTVALDNPVGFIITPASKDVAVNKASTSPVVLSYAVPFLPSALAGDGSTVVSRAIIAPEDRLTEYGQFVVVPEIAANYNPFVEGILSNLASWKTANTWISSSNTDFTKETSFTFSGYPIILRANEDYSEYELYIILGEETRYFRVKFYDTYTHALLLMYKTGGYDNSDSVEIIQTDLKLFTKCVRIHNISSGTKTLQHFVGISDITSSENKTTGLRKIQLRTSFSFDESTMTTPIKYVNDAQGGSFSYLYGNFDDTRNRVDPTDADVTTTGFPDQTASLLTGMFSQGINTEEIGAMVIDGSAGTGGFQLKDWATEYKQ